MTVHGVVARGLYLAARGDDILLPLVFPLLTGLLVLLVLGGVLAPTASRRAFYLALALLPAFTLVRVNLTAVLSPLTADLLSYLLLGLALLLLHQATDSRLRTEPLSARAFLGALPLALPLGISLALVALVYLDPAPVSPALAIPTILVAASVAFLDEYWFRGALQSHVGTATRPAAGYLASVFFFVAFAAPAGDLQLLAYQGGAGLLLGYLVWWRRQLPLALLTRTLAALAIGVLGLV